MFIQALPTMPRVIDGYSYVIDGTPPKRGRKGKYKIMVTHPNGRVTSREGFTSVVEANQYAPSYIQQLKASKWWSQYTTPQK